MTTATVPAHLAGRGAPLLPLVRAELLKLRKRRGLVLLAAALTILPMLIGFTVTYVLHATNPGDHPTAGGIDNYAGSLELLAGLSVVTAILVGVTAGAGDVGSGVFRTLVVTGRSRLQLFAARIPGGLALLLPLVAAGFAVATTASIALAGSAPQPDIGLVVRSGAWVALQATVAFALGLGIGSVLGSRGMSIGLLLGWMLAVEPVLVAINTLGSLRIGLLGAAVRRLEPAALVSDGGGPSVAMSLGAALTVVAAWTLVPLLAGAWRTRTRDA
jgi:ABC-type transport system involved in multi-copper enzyme maturation permease subunit